jgi:CubicO group peptidase (beta-lactamase class C family)
VIRQTDIAAAGLENATVAVSVRSPRGNIDWLQDCAVGDRLYAASLSKQVTAAAIAVLVQRGMLDVDAPIGSFLPGLPSWRDQVTSRHLLHHLGGMLEPDCMAGPGHWTSLLALQRLQESPNLATAPGAVYRYSNAGYICLEAIIERVSGQSFGSFVRTELLDPLGLADLDFTATPDFPQLAGMGDILPLSLGDGGIWTTSAAFADWLDHQNRDTLGLEVLVVQPGRLLDGTPTDYGWGIGLREFRGHPLFIHGGRWPGATAKAVRCPALSLSVAALSTSSDPNSINVLVDKVLSDLAEK